MCLQHRLKRQVSKLHEMASNPSIDDLIKFITSAAREISDPVFGDLGAGGRAKSAGQSHSRNTSQRKGFRGAMTVGSGGSQKNQDIKLYQACNSGECHSLLKCGEFIKMSPEKRYDPARSNQLCYNCLRHGHCTRDCRVEKLCTAQGCRIKHTQVSTD